MYLCVFKKQNKGNADGENFCHKENNWRKLTNSFERTDLTQEVRKHKNKPPQHNGFYLAFPFLVIGFCFIRAEILVGQGYPDHSY